MVTETIDDNRYAGKGAGNAGIALGATGVGLWLLQALGGNLNGVPGGNRPPLPPPATKDDLVYERQLTEKDSEIGQLKAEKYADAAVLAAERRLADKIERLETSTATRFAAQNEYNVANTAAVANVNAKTQELMKLTGLVINAPTMLASEAGATAFKAAA